MHSRRTFVTGLAGGALLNGLGLWRAPAWAASAGTAPVLQGSDFDLFIGQAAVNLGGRPRTAQTINGSLPGPLLRWREGDTVTLRVRNRLAEATSLHWHGIVLPSAMDGVPGLSFQGIAPGGLYQYRFKVRQHGTYWYHSHSGFQEQLGVYGPLVIDPAQPAPYRYDREHVVMLSDWTDENPRRVLARLKEQADYYQQPRTLVDFIHDVAEQGFAATMKDRAMWARMRMQPTDIADVTGQTYTYLANGQAPDGNWTGLFSPGEQVLLRFINGSAMTYFDVRIPGLKMTVVAADGQYVQPVSVDEFRLAVAETLDVLVQPADQPAYTLFAQAMDRSGYARATLAQREGLSAPVPALDARVLVSMADMGMNPGDMQGMSHSKMDHGSMAGMDHMKMGQGAMPGMDHSKMGQGAMPGMDHSKMGQGAMPGMDHSKMGQGDMPGMDHMKMGQGDMPGMDHMKMGQGDMPGMDHMKMSQGDMSSMDHMKMNHTRMPGMDPSHRGPASQPMAGMEVSHPGSEQGNPMVDMQTMNPTARLGDPGIGLRGNGRRVLTYADLASAFPDPDGREPTRTVELHLTGHMGKFVWAFDGVKFADAEPIRLTYGERIRIVLVNDTMMAHPIHLHGMWSDLEDEHGRFKVRKHTLDIPPGTRRSYRVTADALGRWAYHCHMLYHMEAGMFREVRVDA
ncbi:copper resistance system multicopper oxidase [Pseudomonas typographi]|uniref:copper resistance system multicopper oxidase n=1 Tax=Pseudomonas typographi TaxID=2715964 RepID=UPI0016843117|nr:copper resistance system multicopper oxidase [Pseudomonas typographi]MBD1550763.1 copper resistance system multicopper oxidase [Pseudomonas typographi]MBD1587705.1 copper resistance system multicopper oxidase [Pseudomonas typographi]